VAELARAYVLSIGTELTRGEIVNTNAAWLAERLTEIGLDVAGIETIADDAAVIVATLERLSQGAALVVSTGGLGPTTDDITSACVARWLGVKQVRDAAVLAGLEQRLARYGRVLTSSNAQQADFPDGATILDNPHGTAPGFSVARGGCRLFFMPGVPREMRPMFESFVAPAASGAVSGAQHQVRLRCFGVPESLLNDKLAGLEAELGISIGYRAHFPEVQIKLLARAGDAAAARERAEAARLEARQRLGSAVYVEGELDMPSLVSELLRGSKQLLSLAESCTGGLVSSLLTQHSGASDFLLGGVVSYHNQVKIEQLGVSPESLAAHGAVSPEVAKEMAEGARARFRSDLALSLTGIAGPSGATADKPVGLVYFALASAQGTRVESVTVRNRPREGVQLYSAWAGLDLIRQHLTP
jgi:nicotinamide-nucleotide amidase